MSEVHGRRVAMIGAGLAATPWLDALSALDCEVVTVATRDPGRYARVAERFPGAQRCWPPEEALSSPGVNLCVNLSPATSHLDGVRMAAAAGVPLIIEKPLETTLDRAVEAVGMARDGGIPLAVCLQYRYQEGARAMRELVDSAALGRIRAATLDLMWWRSQDYYDEPGRGTYARDGGGVLLTQAIHVLDLLVWYLGLPETVYASHSHGAFHDVETEDVATSILGYTDGSVATTFATTGAMSGEEAKLRLLGEDGSAVLTGNRIQIYDNDGQIKTPGTAATEEAISTVDPMSFSSRWHQGFLDDCLTALEEGTALPVSGIDALAGLSLIDAMERSAKERTEVQPRTPWH